MRDMLTCYYSVMRYVPDTVRDESINIGVMIFEPTQRLLFVRTLDDLEHVRNFDFQANVKWLKTYLSSLQRCCEAATGRPVAAGASDPLFAADPLDALHRASANLIQFTAPRTVLTRDPKAEVEALYTRYVLPRKRQRRRFLPDPQLRTHFRQVLSDNQLLGDKLVQATKIEVTVKSDVIEFPFHYQNSKQNFINPISFAVQNQNQKLREVREFIYKKDKLEESGQYPNFHLLVVAHPPLNDDGESSKRFQQCRAMFADNGIECEVVNIDREDTWQPVVTRIQRELTTTH